MKTQIIAKLDRLIGIVIGYMLLILASMAVGYAWAWFALN